MMFALLNLGSQNMSRWPPLANPILLLEVVNLKPATCLSLDIVPHPCGVYDSVAWGVVKVMES